MGSKKPSAGIINYLSIRGGIESPSFHNSRSVIIRNQIGRLMNKNDLISGIKAYDEHKTTLEFSGETPEQFIPNYKDEITLRVIPAYQNKEINQQLIDKFYNTAFYLTTKKNRMGIHLASDHKEFEHNNIVSEAITLGAIQITPDGSPIILLNDRQTLGGYPKFGCVAQIDLPKIAQAKLNKSITFKPISRKQAQKYWKNFLTFFDLNL